MVENLAYFDENQQQMLLRKLIVSDDIVGVHKLIERGCNLNQRDIRGNTPLHAAISNNSIQMVKLLLEQPNINPNAQNNKKQTPLLLSLNVKNCNELVTILLDGGCDVNIRDKKSKTPLHLAVIRKLTDIALKLISKGADVTCKDEEDITALHIAVRNGLVEVVQELILKGADVNSRDRFDFTPLYLAVTCEIRDIIDILVSSGADVNSKDAEGVSPLHVAVELENIEIIRSLILSKVDVNSKDNSGETPFYLAVKNGYTDIAKMLILEGADVDCGNFEGYAPLHMAVMNNQIDIVYMLLYFNASVNKRTEAVPQMTPFLLGCELEDISDEAQDMLRYLLNYVEDLEETDFWGETALLKAVRNRKNIALDLMDRGANVNVSVDGISCLGFSLLYETSDTFEAIWRRIDHNTLLDTDYEILRYLSKFPDDQFLKCFYLIFASTFINDFLHKYLTKYDYESLYSVIAKKITSAEDRVKLNWLLLSHGVSVYFNDVCFLYEAYGLDESIKAILMSGCCIEPSTFNSWNLLASRICYDSLDPYPFCVRGNLILDASKISGRRYSQFYSVKECTVGYVAKSKAGTLLELSRDAVREVIYKTCRKAHMFKVYIAIATLGLPRRLEDILFLKQPIYSPGMLL